jgi:hypothetical protein
MEEPLGRLILVVSLLVAILPASLAASPIHVAFHWHMHQPIYWPYETVTETEARGAYSFSLIDVHLNRSGPYTTWPSDAVQLGIDAGLGHLGAQVSLSGSLMENLNVLESEGIGFSGWKSSWNTMNGNTTSLGNPRIDLVAFGYHHPLMALIDPGNLTLQIQLHEYYLEQNFGTDVPYSRGMFPPECALHPAMVPALESAGIEWVLVDNIHLQRACQGYPWNSGGNLVEPNPAEQLNPDPDDWISLTNLWAPTQVSAGWSYRPHHLEYVDPSTGGASRIVAVPAARYMGNEDGRGGFGALLYDEVMSQLEPYNTDPDHPLLIVLHHDGDNHGGGSESYYHSNFQNFVDWLVANPTRFVCTTIQDYLDQFPPAADDVIHVEPGSWSGADNGDPEFKKWLGDPAPSGYSPDRNSWSVVTAAENRVLTAEAILPASSMADIRDGTGNATARAWHCMLCGEASDYWYWDGTEMWDSHATRAANLASAEADAVSGADVVGPTLLLPQREPYNPGGSEWGQSQPSDVEIWTYAYDLSGLSRIQLNYREDADGQNSLSTTDNETYAGGPDVGPWQTSPMTGEWIPSQTDPLPDHQAGRFSAVIAGLNEVLVDYYVEAEDSLGHVSRSPIQHVWIGSAGSSSEAAYWEPESPLAGDTLAIYYDPVAGALPDGTDPVSIHIGHSGWQDIVTPDPQMVYISDIEYWKYVYSIPQAATSVDFVFTDGSGNWDNNGGQDWHVPVIGGSSPWVMDGALDGEAVQVAVSGDAALWVDWQSPYLYVATQAAVLGTDRFILLAEIPGAMVSAPWAKAGQVASWDAFLANEGDNGYHGWFDASGSRDAARDTYLEGYIHVGEELGAIPSTIRLAVGVYQTGDGDPLIAQVPGGDGNGDIEADEYLAYSLSTTDVEIDREAGLGSLLLHSYPVPSRGTTTFEVRGAAGLVELSIYDVRGRLVRGFRSAERGQRSVLQWDGRDSKGHSVPTGIYWVRAVSADREITGKVILIR